ncbi:MAG TPA: ROK family protein [Clostridiales bacterium]|nr:ROK family protein [Clostridiales bacterium]
MKNLIGIDIGGTKCAAVLGRYDEDGAISIIEKCVYPTEKGPEHMLNQLSEGIEKLLCKFGLSNQDIEGIGVSCGSPLNSKLGVILSPPNLIGWDNIYVNKYFEDRFGIKTRLQNDANACALAEWKFGAGKGCNNVIFLTFGTGMGAGLILDGRLYTGTNDMAGEVGHIRLDSFGPVGYGKSGSFEGFCSGGGIAQLARMKVLEKIQMGTAVSFCHSIDDLPKLNAKIVADAAKNGDELAKEIFDISGEYLGRGLSIIIDILNPEVIIIGSIFERCTDLLWPKAQEIIARETLPVSKCVCKVVPAVLGDSIGDYAALAVALYE